MPKNRKTLTRLTAQVLMMNKMLQTKPRLKKTLGSRGNGTYRKSSQLLRIKTQQKLIMVIGLGRVCL